MQAIKDTGQGIQCTGPGSKIMMAWKFTHSAGWHHDSRTETRAFKPSCSRPDESCMTWDRCQRCAAQGHLQRWTTRGAE